MDGPAIEELLERHRHGQPMTATETAVWRRVLELADGGVEDAAARALASYDPTISIERT